MPRSILGTKLAENILGLRVADATTNSPSTSTLSPAALQARLRQKRSTTYIDAMTRLDAGGHTHSATQTQALVDAIQQEFREVSVESLPLGIVAKCYLGAPYEVHTLDCSGSIVTHYKTHEGLPHLLERARSLAKYPTYAFIEVYATKLIAVNASGQPAIIEA